MDLGNSYFQMVRLMRDFTKMTKRMGMEYFAGLITKSTKVGGVKANKTVMEY